MTIIAIDPGPEESAMVIYRPDDSGLIRRRFGAAEVDTLLFEKSPNTALLAQLRRWSTANELVIEQVASFGMPVGAEVFETVFWSGRFAQAWGRPFHRIKRHEVKMHLCHNMRAKDSNIRQALIDKLGPPGTKKNPGPTYGVSGDCWSALAVAVTYAETQK